MCPPKPSGIAATLAGVMLLFCIGFSYATEFTLPLTDMESKATSYFMSPLGQGTQDGSSDANALPFAKIAELVREAKTSTRIILLPGNYDITDAIVLRSFSANDVLVLEGRDNAVIRGKFDFDTGAGTGSGLRLHGGNVIVRGVDFENTGFCVKANKVSAVSQVLIENIDARNVHSCILVDRDSQQAVTHWIVRNSRIKGYYRVGIRLAGDLTHDFMIDNLQIDGAHNHAKSECYKAGIQLLDGVGNVDVRNSTIENNIGSCGDAYQQGDGIEADHKGGKPNNIRIDNVRIANSGDADMDLKADNVTMSNIATLGGDLTRFAFKVWGYRNYQCSNCYARGVHGAYVNINRAGMTFRDSSFSNAWPVHPCDLRHGPAPEQPSFVKFENAQMYVGNEEWINDCGANILSAVKRMPEGSKAPPAPVTDVKSH